MKQGTKKIIALGLTAAGAALAIHGYINHVALDHQLSAHSFATDLGYLLEFGIGINLAAFNGLPLVNYFKSRRTKKASQIKDDNPGLEQRIGSYYQHCEDNTRREKNAEEQREQKAEEIYASITALADYIENSPLVKIIQERHGEKIEITQWCQPKRGGLWNYEQYRITLKYGYHHEDSGTVKESKLTAHMEYGPFYSDDILLTQELIAEILQINGAANCIRLLKLTPKEFEKRLVLPNEPGYDKAEVRLLDGTDL